jgi:hypothetical protein
VIGARAPETRLALDERQRAEVLTVKPEQVEGDEGDEGEWVTAAEHLDKDRPPGLAGADDLAVEHGVLHAETLRQRRCERPVA